MPQPQLWESVLASFEVQSEGAEEPGLEAQELPAVAKKPRPSPTTTAWLSEGTQAQLWAHRCDPTTMEADRRLKCTCGRGNCVGNITANGMAARRTTNKITGTVNGGEEGRSQRDYCRMRLLDFLEPPLLDDTSKKSPLPTAPPLTLAVTRRSSLFLTRLLLWLPPCPQSRRSSSACRLNAMGRSAARSRGASRRASPRASSTSVARRSPTAFSPTRQTWAGRARRAAAAWRWRRQRPRLRR